MAKHIEVIDLCLSSDDDDHPTQMTSSRQQRASSMGPGRVPHPVDSVASGAIAATAAALGSARESGPAATDLTAAVLEAPTFDLKLPTLGVVSMPEPSECIVLDDGSDDESLPDVWDPAAACPVRSAQASSQIQAATSRPTTALQHAALTATQALSGEYPSSEARSRYSSERPARSTPAPSAQQTRVSFSTKASPTAEHPLPRPGAADATEVILLSPDPQRPTSPSQRSPTLAPQNLTQRFQEASQQRANAAGREDPDNADARICLDGGSPLSLAQRLRLRFLEQQELALPLASTTSQGTSASLDRSQAAKRVKTLAQITGVDTTIVEAPFRSQMPQHQERRCHGANEADHQAHPPFYGEDNLPSSTSQGSDPAHQSSARTGPAAAPSSATDPERLTATHASATSAAARKVPEAAREVSKRSAQLRRELSRQNRPEDRLATMSVYCCATLLEARRYKKLREQLEAQQVSVQVTNGLPLKMSIRFMRRVDTLNETTATIESCLEEEPHVLMVLWADTFVPQATDMSIRNLAREIKTHYQDLSKVGLLVTLIVEGVEPYFRKQSNAANRAWRQQVSTGEAADTDTDAMLGKIAQVRTAVDHVLIWLQMEAGLHLRETNTADETMELICMMTKSIATLPDKLQAAQFNINPHVTHCEKVDSATFRGLRQLWRRQLSCFSWISDDKAEAIVQHYPTPLALAQGFRQHGVDAVASLVPVGHARAVGQAIAEKLKVYLESEDPNLML
ncbi:uncharacterized protein MONBRDRAFT_26875 [Monosiga brevicollis MX1]|uniref:ERCC4 domain-containing protein n=1 Tax=Monosiga brevicollis TaxID=81824 RepID=A9V3S9_MONBE|nr:uncharacterized protein MONBRDRAFT_26875 [Monosiga brevicollis MX1]EDQ87862.1 predicted protein [Monosiga brevicollis MX1]|eukprot:XP_001747395.1 hypothetical protein [Monosiga brevicollis MX1]